MILPSDRGASRKLPAPGAVTTTTACPQTCSKEQGILDHVRWPDTDALVKLLNFLRLHTLEPSRHGISH
jgi:hypothetical protein